MTLTVSDPVPALVAGNAVVLAGQPDAGLCARVPSCCIWASSLRALYAIAPGPVVGTATSTDNCDYLRSPVHRRPAAARRARRLPAYRFLSRTWWQEPMIVARVPLMRRQGGHPCLFSNAGHCASH